MAVQTTESHALYFPQNGAPNYFPNSFGGPDDDPRYSEIKAAVTGDVSRYNNADDDNFTQPGIFYRQASHN